jgi:hypothetical protein
MPRVITQQLCLYIRDPVPVDRVRQSSEALPQYSNARLHADEVSGLSYSHWYPEGTASVLGTNLAVMFQSSGLFAYMYGTSWTAV